MRRAGRLSRTSINTNPVDRELIFNRDLPFLFHETGDDELDRVFRICNRLFVILPLREAGR